MTTCKDCNNYIPDIGDPHTCPVGYKVTPGFSVPRDFVKVGSQKCDMCGSTAIDHTEMQCQINRTLKLRLPNHTQE